jgi:hypothetical protein
MTDAPQPKRRGRPPAAPGAAKDARIELRLTREQREKLERLGGAQWVRDRIDSARER